MADLVIRGMEMPQECNWKTIRLYPNGTCAFQNGEGDYNVIPYAAIQLPAKHGRLIDADALIEQAEPDGGYGHMCVYLETIGDAPTIVPAEGGTGNV
jgi:hypothetical protein